jgi:outer membrane cobalamin receptor
MKYNVICFERRARLRVTPMTLAIAGLFSANAVLAQDKKPGAADEAPATVIVTGVMAQTQAKDANISYNVLTKEDIQRFTPSSASDLLRDMPGVNVESNDGVGRNEVYTRGMSVGSGGPTAGNFWSSMMEDGLPVLPQQFSGFQAGNFLRTDLSTSRVESVRGGSTGTTFGSSVGGAFNYISAPIKNGGSVQTKLGFQGDNYHLGWKEVDALFGWVNKNNDAGFNASIMSRRAQGAPDVGYDLDHGGQIKVNAFKRYETAGGGSGQLKLSIKHLDDTNAAMSNNAIPTYGYASPQIVPGFGRNANFYINGGQHSVPDGNGGYIYQDPQEGYRYKQDAIWLKWDHDTGGPWSFSGAVKGQYSSAFGQQSQTNGVVSLWNVAAFQNNFAVNQASSANAAQNLNRLPGYYELYDLNTGALQARIANNVGTSQGINYRTGAPCAAGTATGPAQCVVSTNLPTPNYDLRGGLVNGKMVPADATSAQNDMVQQLRSELTMRQSRDFMFFLQSSYHDDRFDANFGLYADQVHQEYHAYGSGFSIAPFADGQTTPLGVRFVAKNGPTYQLTDSGGWGKYGSGAFSTFHDHMSSREISPYLSGTWRINDHWDVDANYKTTLTHYSTTVSNYVQNPQISSATGRNFGGLDGNPLTWYDNTYFVPPSVPIKADKSLRLHSFSYALGYSFNPQQKVYYRYSRAQNNLSGAVSRWGSAASLQQPLTPQAEQWSQELAWNFEGKRISGQMTYFWTQAGFPVIPSGTDVDGTVYFAPEYINTYVTHGVEAWARVKLTDKLTWQTSATFATGKTQSETTFNAAQPGPQDDTYKTVSNTNIPKLAKWTTSNTLSYKYGDFWFNLRHRWMDKRRVNADPANPLTLPIQNNTDLAVQYLGLKNTRISFEVRNLFNNMYISALDTNISSLPSGVTKVDVYNQLPNSASFIKVNSSRSFWLTLQHDF